MFGGTARLPVRNQGVNSEWNIRVGSRRTAKLLVVQVLLIGLRVLLALLILVNISTPAPTREREPMLDALAARGLGS